MKRFALYAASFLIVLGCQKANPSSKVDGLSANQEFSSALSVPNIALIVIGDSSGIPGTKSDFKNMQNLFRNSKLKFQVRTLEYPSGAELRATLTEIAQEMARYDTQAYQRNIPGGTFALYFTSHGSADGLTSLNNGSDMIGMKDIAEALRAGRNVSGQQIPMQRFIAMFDTCHSASNAPDVGSANTGNAANSGVQGGAMLSSSQLFQTANGQFSQLGGNLLYRQSISWYSSRASETSADTGTGGAATVAFINAMNAALGIGGASSSANPFGPNMNDPRQQADDSSQARIEDVANRMIQATKPAGQTPVWCYDPPEAKGEYIAGAPQGALAPIVGTLDPRTAGKPQCTEPI